MIKPDFEEKHFPKNRIIELELDGSRMPKFPSSAIKAKSCIKCGCIRFVNLIYDDFVCKHCRQRVDTSS